MDSAQSHSGMDICRRYGIDPCHCVTEKSGEESVGEAIVCAVVCQVKLLM